MDRPGDPPQLPARPEAPGAYGGNVHADMGAALPFLHEPSPFLLTQKREMSVALTQNLESRKSRTSESSGSRSKAEAKVE